MTARDRMHRMIARLIPVVLAASTAGRVQAQSPPPAGPDPTRDAITRVLDDQTLAWNRGDLDAFLVGYWHSPRVVFQSGGTRHDGFDAMRDRYRKRYQGEGKSMGQVAFSGVEIEPLAADAAFVRGRYTLTLPDRTRPTGLFTLIMRRFDDGWKITHDHTSAADTPPPGFAPEMVAPLAVPVAPRPPVPVTPSSRPPG